MPERAFVLGAFLLESRFLSSPSTASKLCSLRLAYLGTVDKIIYHKQKESLPCLVAVVSALTAKAATIVQSLIRTTCVSSM